MSPSERRRLEQMEAEHARRRLAAEEERRKREETEAVVQRARQHVTQAQARAIVDWSRDAGGEAWSAWCRTNPKTHPAPLPPMPPDLSAVTQRALRLAREQLAAEEAEREAQLPPALRGVAKPCGRPPAPGNVTKAHRGRWWAQGGRQGEQ